MLCSMVVSVAAFQCIGIESNENNGEIKESTNANPQNVIAN